MPACVPKRPAGDGADMLLKLRNGACVACPVAGIMNPRREFIDDQAPVIQNKKFNADDTDVIKAFHQAGCDIPRFFRCLRLHGGRRRRCLQNTAAMNVFDGVVMTNVAVCASSRDNRNLPIEGNKSLEDGRRRADFIPCEFAGFLERVR